MDTSGESLPSIILYVCVLALFVQVAIRLVRASTLRRGFPVVALVFGVLIGVPSLLQFAVPAIGDALDRQPQLTLGNGQWWRVLTSVAAQDGGLVAAIFNLVVLIAVIGVGEWVWGRWRTIVLFLLPTVILNLLALGWGAVGGGSSFATDGLLASMCALALLTLRGTVAKIFAVAPVGIGIFLIALDDAHGLAILVGAALGALFALPRLGVSGAESRRSPRPRS